jgi:AraC-like DNA-binding protein
LQRPNITNASGPHTTETGLETLVIREIEAILSKANDIPTVEHVATCLELNVRALQRRLGKRKLTFRGLLDDCRRNRAIAELVSDRLPIAVVASGLGYSDPAHFARAFRRWTGRTPSDYRKAPS